MVSLNAAPCSALECARIQNSIAHLERTNDEIRSFLAEKADTDLSLALEENIMIMSVFSLPVEVTQSHLIKSGRFPVSNSMSVCASSNKRARRSPVYQKQQTRVCGGLRQTVESCSPFVAKCKKRRTRRRPRQLCLNQGDSRLKKRTGCICKYISELLHACVQLLASGWRRFQDMIIAATPRLTTDDL